MRKALLFGALALFALALAACGGSSNEFDIVMEDFSFTPNAITLTAGTEVTINLENKGFNEHEILFVRIDGDEHVDLFDNDPSKVTASGGEGFHVGSAEEIEEEGYHVELEPGATGTLTFTVPDKVGEWEMACFIGDGAHYDQGMHGTVTIVAAE
jgi:uncharacterized cupredoxin-like copper-binding protein